MLLIWIREIQCSRYEKPINALDKFSHDKKNQSKLWIRKINQSFDLFFLSGSLNLKFQIRKKKLRSKLKLQIIESSR